MSFLRHRRKHFRSNPNFVIQVKTDNTGTSGDDQIMLPIQGTNMVIDWGDGSAPETVTQANAPNNTLVGGNNVVHTYSSAGTYEISISNVISAVRFTNDGDCRKLTDIKNWGTAVWSTMDGAFNGCSNMDMTASDMPDFSACITLKWMLRICYEFNRYIGDWDVSNIQSFFGVLHGAIQYNQPLTNWDTSAGIDTNQMFYNMSAFKQDISHLDFSNSLNFTNFLNLSNINETGTTTNYDDLLNSLAAQNVNNSLTFHGGTSKYSAAGETARWQLIAVHDSALADASGTDKSTYDAEAAGFQYWDTGESKIYIKKSATSANWTTALSLGKSWTITDGGLA